MKNDQGMSSIVKSAVLVVAIPATMFGLYVISHGHLTPGGGFPGGAIMASVVAMFLVAYGSKMKMGKNVFSVLESIGLVAFALLAFAGISQAFFRNVLANSGQLFGMPVPFGPNPGYLNTGGLIPLMNFAVGLEVFAALSLIIIMMYRSGEGKK